MVPVSRPFQNRLEKALSKQKALINKVLPWTKDFNNRGEKEMDRFAKQVAYACPQFKMPRHTPLQPWQTKVRFDNDHEQSYGEDWSCNQKTYTETCTLQARTIGFSNFGDFKEPYWQQVITDPVPSVIARRHRRRPNYQVYTKATKRQGTQQGHHEDVRYVIYKPRFFPVSSNNI